MLGILAGREGEITVKVPTSTAKGRVGEFDPAGKLIEKTYKLRFSMRALIRAERHFSTREALVVGQALAPVGILNPGTVQAILDRLLNGTLENYLLLLFWMLIGDQPNVTEPEMVAVAEADFDRVQAVVYEVLGRALPEPKTTEAGDPKAPAAEMTTETTADQQPSTIS